MIYVILLQSLIIGGFIYALLKVLDDAKDERMELEDRLMAMCDPHALTQVEVIRDDLTPARVSYMDDARMAELDAKPA